MRRSNLLQAFVCLHSLGGGASFGIGRGPLHRGRRSAAATQVRAEDRRRGDADGGGSSYDTSASLIKGVVSSLTSLSNSIFRDAPSMDNVGEAVTSSKSAPTSPQELLSRIRDDYTINNYLWTGNLDTSAFSTNCTFTDPTLSFVGVDRYVENVGNLVPVITYLLGDEQLSRSELLEISLNEEKGYIQTRWNMVGELNRLPWRPRIDVIGNTKFWYTEGNEEGDPRAVRVYFYDEEWEIPAGKALLQLVTRAGTIPNTSER
ncbi:hypothetical protein ACHAXT_012424 [Thalassiosira profunda]